MDDQDYYRFMYDLYEFNDAVRVLNFGQKIKSVNNRSRTSIKGSATSITGWQEVKPRKLIVDIIAYCLMPNHFHLLLRQKREKGIQLFLQKIGTGYTHYFNTRYERSGVLFQGRSKAALVESDVYLSHLSRYIHLNPVEITQPGWKEDGIKDRKSAQQFLEQYKWSSYPDYIGKKNFPSLINTEPMSWYFSDVNTYKQFVGEWLEKNGSSIIGALALES